MIRGHYNLAIYFHCWADQGLVPCVDGKYAEGHLIPGYYQRMQELVDFLCPAAFAIESALPDLVWKNKNFPSVILSSMQGSRRKIFSQLYSINHANAILEAFEASERIQSDVVVRMRFDVVPHTFTLKEINYVAAHPNMRVLFAPSPAFHVHPGGGGGCQDCQRFFDANSLRGDFEICIQKFLKYHRPHANDICDIFAVGSSKTMKHYTQIYNKAHLLIGQIQDSINPRIMQDYCFVQDDEEASDRRIQSTSAYPFDIEESPIFVPEKLIRFQMAGFLIVHGETVVVIHRC